METSLKRLKIENRARLAQLFEVRKFFVAVSRAYHATLTNRTLHGCTSRQVSQ